MKYLKVALFIFNLLIWLAGCTVLVIGVWLLLESSKGHILNLFVSDVKPYETINLIAYSLLGLGSIVFAVGLFGCRAALRGNQCILATYMSMLVALIVTELVTAAIGGLMTFQILSDLEDRLADKLAMEYGHDATSDIPFSNSLDFAQYKNKNTGSPMSVVTRVFHKNNEKPWLHPMPKDEAACQVQDEEGHEGYRHKEGCLGKVTNWLQCESFTLVFLGMAMAGIQTFGIITSAFLCRTIRDMQEE
ncbi:PREDICTED: tetraspanin-2-like isoform X2 [Vollenhovia emeryi]|uniref:tetraspanin-2-like isoform X2 n=1 Tax=Vollenhovia emeryi TaxID=411798 RepID=UPI0005F58D8B|nr:PREDICTED: tetraspanin-2-like isoform X2 [Vollenhovia emeryi]